MSVGHWSEVKPWSKRQYAKHVEEVAELNATGQYEEAQLVVIRNRLNHYAKVRRVLDEKGSRPVDEMLWKTLGNAILPHTYWRFRDKFAAWYWNVKCVPFF